MLQKSTFFWFLICAVLSTNNPLEARAQFTADQEKSVSIIYNKWFSKPLHAALTSSKWPSVLAGLYANTRISSVHIQAFIKKYSINIDEIQDPLSSFKTFNDFFKRKLKPEARPLSQEPDAIISPADGGVLVIENLGLFKSFTVKGTPFNLEKLLKNKDLAKDFEGSTAFIVRLAPWDYHRMHFPLSGTPSQHTVIHGKYESVHPLVYASGIQPLQINERHLILLKSDTASTIALIPVGALFVGAIKETYTPHQYVTQGDEIGYFTFGGSTIVLLFKAGTITVAPEILRNSADGKETPVKMGQLIAKVTAF
jgi:phosphatidylserine decarboxylase